MQQIRFVTSSNEELPPEVSALLTRDGWITARTRRRQHIIQAISGTKLAGAAVLARHGRSRAQLALSTRVVDGQESLLKLLGTRAVAEAKASGVRMLQAVTPAEPARPPKAVMQLGFKLMTSIVCMRWDVAPRARADASSVDLIVCGDSEQGDFADCVQATFSESADVPELSRWQTAKEMVCEAATEPGHRVLYWLEHDRLRIGCLMLGRGRRPGEYEIVYMGVLPEYRGRGFGTQAVRLQQRALAEGRQAERLLVGVDTRNDPAIAIYTKCGFYELTTTHLWYLDLEAEGVSKQGDAD